MKRRISSFLACVLTMALCWGTVQPALAAAPQSEQDTAAEYLRDQGIMVGDENGGLMLDKGLTRVQLAAILARMTTGEEHLQADKTFYAKQCIFTDVPDWAKVYVGYCAANHLVEGYGNGLYGSNDPVTSAAACTVMLRSLEDTGSGWSYQSACLKAVELGLVPAFAVSEPEITRGNMAILLYRTMQRLGIAADGDVSGETVTSADGERYIPKVGDVIVCDDGYRYEIKDLTRYNNSMFATEETGSLPTPTCDWSLFPQPELPGAENRHFTANGKEYLFMRNLYETRRMQYTLYNAIGANSQTWQDGKPVTRKNGDPLVLVNLSIPNDVNAFSFWPWSSSQITELFNSCPPGEYSMEAWDVYCDGVFRYTEYYIHVK